MFYDLKARLHQQKDDDSLYFATLARLQWSGTEPTVSARHACVWCDRDVETSIIYLSLTSSKQQALQTMRNRLHREMCLFWRISLAENPQLQKKSIRGRDFSAVFLFLVSYLRNRLRYCN